MLKQVQHDMLECAVTLNLFQGLNQALPQIPKQVRNDRKNAQWTVTLNLVQGLSQGLLEMLKRVQHDKKLSP